MGEYTVVSVPLGKMNSKSEDSVSPFPELAYLQNVQMQRTGGYQRRYGYISMATTDIGGNSVMGSSGTMPVALAPYQDSMLALTADGKMYEYSIDQAAWVSRGTNLVVRIDSKGIGGDPSMTPLCADMAILSGGYRLYAVASTDATGAASDVSFTILDSEGTVVGVRSGLDTPATALTTVKVVANGGDAWIVWNSTGNTLRGFHVSASALNTALTSGSATTITSDYGGTTAEFDIYPRTDAKIFIAYLSTTLTAGVKQTIKWGFVDTSLALANTSTLDTTRSPVAVVCAVESGMANHAFVYADGTNPNDIYAVHRAWNGSAWSATAASGALDVGLTAIPLFVWMACRFDDATTLRVWYTASDTVSFGSFELYQATYTTAGVGNRRAVSLHQTGLLSKPFMYNSRWYFWGYQVDTGQIGEPYTVSNPTAYLFDSATGAVVGQAEPGVAFPPGGGFISIGQTAITGSTARCSLLRATRVVSVGTSVFGGLAVDDVKVSFADDESYRLAESRDSVLIPGGMLQEYDGLYTVESGFLRPFTSECWDVPTASSAAGGLTNSKQYFYIVIPEWTNFRGDRMLGSTGGSKSVTLGGADNTVTIHIRTMTATKKLGTVPDLIFGVYRTNDTTPSDNSAFYRVGQVVNNPSANEVTFTDVMIDAQAAIQEQFYLGTGELDNVAPPASHIIAKGNGRVCLAANGSVYFSKFKTDGRALEFNDALRVDVPNDGGDITALAWLNDTLVIFKRDRIYRLRGQGPNNAGVGGFLEPELVVSDNGCITQHSTVITPQGLMFQSLRGIMLLDQGFGVSYIGAALEGSPTALGTCVDSVLVPNIHQVRFSDGSQTAVYDYFHGSWVFWTSSAVGPSCLLGGTTHVMPASNTKVWQQDNFTYTDDGTAYATQFILAWLASPNSHIQSFKVRKIGVFGTTKANSVLNLSVYYDGAASASFTKANTLTAGTLRLLVTPTSAVANQLRVKLEDIIAGPTSTTNEGVVLTEVTFEVLIKKGLHPRTQP